MAEQNARQFSELMKEFLVGPKSVGRPERGEITITPLHWEGGRHISDENKRQVIARSGDLITSTTVTDAFKIHIAGIIFTQLEGTIASARGPGFVEEECGINLERGAFGIFDPEKAKDVERETIVRNLESPPFFDDDAINEWNAKMHNWIGEYREKYGEDPIDS